MTQETTNLLRHWGITPQYDCPTKNVEVTSYLDKWLQSYSTNLMIVERPTDCIVNPTTIVEWLFTKIMHGDSKPSLICKCSGLDVIAFESEEDRLLRMQRLHSAPMVWLQELSASSLSDAQRNKLFQFLQSCSGSNKTVVISVSLPIKVLVDWVGHVLSRVFERQFTILAV
ncbi:MAG: hypothetical protein UY48_C0027G0009 [Candidatus Gottesmanbacteria bacterium GW2011_GWB1_49_7]|uniref:Uncharacterized protein n=1 Tax=Candidatus Gottesmanbacteria bacterium GW2011_GWB1_49_7 TaxID=1618448 RepID=A0A0G1Y814_9BACT|nr:MAG: hypothetical protein UY48_C0027G0009 [Candidatus Gottesmanbacteria bacterium GW2011_GWB1_49_7]